MLTLMLALLGQSVTAVPAGPAPQAPVAQAEPASRISEDDLLLLSVLLDQLTLTESLTAYGDAADPWIPLSEIVRLLDLGVDVSPAEQRVVGTVGEAARPLTIDLRSGVASVGGERLHVDRSVMFATQTEIYVKASQLGRFIPAAFSVDGENLSLTIAPTETLPIQSRMERLARTRNASHSVEGGEAVTIVPSPYELVSPPAVDVVLEARRPLREQAFARRYDVRVAGDLLFTNYQAYLGSDERGRPADARLLLERRSAAGNLLGPLHATRVSGGDVFTPALPLGPRSVAGRGFSFSTAPLEQASVFETIDLRGELPLGYDVELYVNDVLRNSQSQGAQGRYEFLDVPLTRGVNIIRVVSFGPRGERSEQVRILNVGGGQVPKGQLYVNFGAVEQERSLFGLGSGAARSGSPASGALRVAGTFAYGISEAISVVGGASIYSDFSGVERSLVTAGLRTSIYGFATFIDAAADQRGGRAASAGVAGRVGGVSLVLEHSEYGGGFVDENQLFGGGSDILRRHSEATVDFSVAPLGGRLVPISVRALRDEFAGGQSWAAQFRASTSVGQVLVSTGLDYQRRSFAAAPTQERLGGVLTAATYLNFQWQLRAALDYDILPGTDLRALTITADRALSERVALHLGLGHSFSQPQSTALQAAMSFRFPFGDASLAAEWELPRGGWSLGARLAFGIGYDPNGGGYRLVRPGVAAGGSVAFRAFIDRDGDGRFGAGEEPVAGVSVEGGERPGRTGPLGTAFVTGLGNPPTAHLQVGMDNVEAGNLSLPSGRLQFAPRPGKVLQLDYPLAPTGEVMLQVRTARGGEMVPLAAVRLLLVRDGAEAVAGTTEFDGQIILSNLPLGNYHVILDPQQAERLHIRLSTPIAFTLGSTAEAPVDVQAEIVFDAGAGGQH